MKKSEIKEILDGIIALNDNEDLNEDLTKVLEYFTNKKSEVSKKVTARRELLNKLISEQPCEENVLLMACMNLNMQDSFGAIKRDLSDARVNTERTGYLENGLEVYKFNKKMYYAFEGVKYEKMNHIINSSNLVKPKNK